jgi:hypothetical protein
VDYTRSSGRSDASLRLRDRLYNRFLPASHRPYLHFRCR